MRILICVCCNQGRAAFLSFLMARKTHVSMLWIRKCFVICNWWANRHMMGLSKARNNGSPSGTEIFGRAPRFLDLGARMTPSEKYGTVYKPFIYPSTEILDPAQVFLYLGGRLVLKKKNLSLNPALWKLGDLLYAHLRTCWRKGEAVR